MVLRLLQNAFMGQNLNLFVFAYTSKQNSPPRSYHHPPDRRKLPIFNYENLLFPPAERESARGNYERAENVTIVKLVRVLVTSFESTRNF